MSIMKLDRFLVSASRYSRRDVYALVTEGQVTLNGRVVTDMTVPVRVGRDVVTVSSEVVVFEGRLFYYKLYKPLGVLSTLEDPKGRVTLAAYLEKLPKGTFPIGRLDRKSSGLLLVTNDGVFANTLMHPSFKLPKTYRVGLDKIFRLSDAQKLISGFFLDDGPVRFDAVTVVDKKTLDVVISEGRNHIVRRSFANLGYEVQKLHRTAIGHIHLGGLTPGQSCPLSEVEVASVLTLQK
jgi:23S rRNA pseudouridine2605 synthase